MKEIQIRPIRKEDISGLNEIRRQPAVTENTLGLPSERIERTEEFFNRLGPDDHVFVAVTGSTVVGMGALFVNSGKLRHMGRLVLMVHGDFQNKGIGSSLLNTLLHLADHDLGLIRLELDVVVDNESAIHLYKKFGFEIEGRLKKAHFSRGEYQDIFIMGRVK
ncbi:GNAT family N-acetyltransferase [Caldifermentibacillus hisashii]|uniref:GNAT family N-acetyltransferase n=1 Tax=Caldifermentibacillus hisashii TaxID=996558 RepID=UPI0030EA8852